MSHYLIFGNAAKILPKLNLNVDAIIVDPPYNTANKNTKTLKGRKARSSDFGRWDYFSDQDYLKFTENWIKLAKPILKKSGNLLTFCKLEYVSDVRRLYEKEGFKHHGTIIWHKTNPAPQIRKTGFLSSCEAILWATNGFDDNKISYTFNFSKQNEMHNFMEYPICMGKERTPHPTQKPKRVLSHLVKIFTNENDLILDCFAGSGTLAEVANDMNRSSINIENDKNYFNIMKNRLKKIDKLKPIVVKNSEIQTIKKNG
jgi:site-specific DNA-methyltransferase (adenine-specific)/modification methylase